MTYTKAEQIEHQLRAQLRSGRWKVGDQLPAEYDLLKELDVSRTTLRHALSAMVSDGLLARKPGAGTIIKNMGAGKAVAIYVNASNLASPTGFYYKTTVDEARRCIENSGYRAILATGHGDTMEEVISASPLFDSAGMKSLVGVLNLQGWKPVLQEYLAKQGIPCVTINISHPEAHAVVLDYSAMLQISKEAFESHGYSNFAIMCLVPDKETPVEFSVRRYNLPVSMVSPENLVQVWNQDIESAYDLFKQWWALPNRPDGILFADDGLCAVALRAILELGIEIPGELGIITHSNAGRSFRFSKKLTRIEFDALEAVDEAWKILHGELSMQPVETIRFILPHLREGESLALRAGRESKSGKQ